MATDPLDMTVLWEYGEEEKRLRYVEASVIGYNNESKILIDFREYNLVGDLISENLNITSEYYWKTEAELTNLLGAGASTQNMTIVDENIKTIQHTILYNEIEQIYTYDNATGVLVQYENSDGVFVNLLSWSEVNIQEFAAEENSTILGFPLKFFISTNITALILLVMANRQKIQR